MHTFDAADGMPRDAAFCVVPDSKGFLWVCTNEGLSWFDGYRFNNYGVTDGLAHRIVNTVVQTSGGTLLAGTDGGLSRLGPADPEGPSRKFRTVPATAPSPKGVFDLVQDPDGVVWGAGFNGIFRLEHPDSPASELHFVEIARGKDSAGNGLGITALAADRDGTLWIGTSQGLARRLPNGRIDWPEGVPAFAVNTLLIDRENRLWVGTLNGLWRVEIPTKDAKLRAVRWFTKQDGLASERIHCLHESSSGTLWVGTAASLSELWIDTDGREHFRNYSAAEGLRGRRVTSIGEDRGGNLWVGMDQGLSRISRSGFVTYSEKEGVGDLAMAALITLPGRPGREPIAISNHTDRLELHQYENDRFTAVTPFFPPSMHYFGWGWDQIALIDRENAWWIATGEGVLRYPRVSQLAMLAHAAPQVYTTRNAGLPSNDVFRIFEDSRGDIWISAFEGAPVRWHRSENQFEPSPRSFFPGMVSAFAEDRAGNVWMGLSNDAGTGNPSGLIRYHQGQFERYVDPGKLTPGWISSMLIDHLGRLWIATASVGLEMVSDPTAAEPRAAQVPAHLSSVSVRCLAEDRQGRIWAGTARGLDRLDPSTGEIRYFNSAQGYPGGGCSALRVDSDGTLWAASSIALSRFVPGGDGAEEIPPVYVTGVFVEGAAKGAAERLPSEVNLGQLGPQQNWLRIEFSSPAAVEGRAIRYEYALQRAGKSSAVLSDQRTIEYPGLAPGQYHFRVSAINERGQRSSVPAEILFEILPPVWARWWFVTLLAAAAAAAVHAVYRFKLSKQLELERLRTRIAADLHDDLGASLTRMTILTELASRQAQPANPKAGRDLSRIAEMARGMVDALGELVWAVDPRRDDMASTARRIRRYSSDVLEPHRIAWTFETPRADLPPLTPEQRRHVLLIFQEALRNAGRHAHCSHVELFLHVEAGEYVVRIRDNGCGLPDPIPELGSGLLNLRSRAAALGGRLSIVSSPGAGTDLTVRFPAGKTGRRMGRMFMLFRERPGVRSNRR